MLNITKIFTLGKIFSIFRKRGLVKMDMMIKRETRKKALPLKSTKERSKEAL